ncbi:MAG: glycerate kinase [Bacteroidales bacterium]|nr:glycerate kinase [Bacteroidales bacterium]
MKILIAPDSFKGCLPAREVAAALSSALRSRHPDWEVTGLPLADGGEGTLDALAAALHAEVRLAQVSDPLGRSVSARYGLAGATAVIEVAEACGLPLLAPAERDPLRASTYGVGELLLAARAAGAKHFLIGLGGTATCDGGSGMLQVQGLREALQDCKIELLSDVDNPLVGPTGAARVFAPQKGATPEAVAVLERRLEAQADALRALAGREVRMLPGAGAAGGLGAAFLAAFDAVCVRGIDRILDAVGFSRHLPGADFIVTGEGRSDRQTLHGKVPYGVLRRAGAVPVILLSGRIEDRDALAAAGFARLVQASPDGLPTAEAVRPAVAVNNLRRAALELFP